MTHTLSREDARRLIVRAQLLDANRPGDVVEVAEQLTEIKIDPTAVIAPAQHATAWARIGWGYEPGQLVKAVEDDRVLFEYDGTIRPVSVLPLMIPRMRRWPQYARVREWMDANARFADDVLARLRADGPLPASAIQDTAQVARQSESGWYGPNQVPRMLECLERQGRVAVVGRAGRLRRWDVVERVWPPDLPEYSDTEAARLLDVRRLQAAGIARQRSPWTPVGEAGEPAVIEGVKGRWRVDPQALAGLDDDPGGRVAVLNPYDRVLFDRPRLRDVFEFDYVLEQFKPKTQRVYGQFAHPILVGDRFVALLDAALDRKRETLQVTAIHELAVIEPEEMEMIRAEIADLGEWLGVPVTGLG
ncbi:MAG TPA: crosslink repair DNA glycosylase YcaQ family protein [Microbacterium sp.]|nr:crosslink repair DNA glycosylase YcaQ family protein [Microbacterium sp.]